MSLIRKNLQTQLAMDKSSELSQKALKAIEIKYLLQAYFSDLDMLRLQTHIGPNERIAAERAQNVETLDQILELSGQGNEITKLIGELAENAHTFIHIPEEASKLLVHGGGVGALISGTIGFATIPLLCALEKRKPKPTEAALMGLSMATIVFGALAVAAVGGPIGVGAFVLAITTLGLGRVALNYFHEWRERKALEKEVKHLKKELYDLENTLNYEMDKISKLKNKLMKELNNPSSTIDHKAIESLQSQLENSTAHLESALKELETKSVIFADKSSKLLKLQEKRTSRWEIARKGIYIGAGVLAVIGAILMLTPAAPIGGVLMLTASIISATTLISSFIVNRIKSYQAQKSQTKAEHSLHQIQEMETKSEHSSEYVIAESLTPQGKSVQHTLQKELKNASITQEFNEKNIKSGQPKSSRTFIEQELSQIKNTAKSKLHKNDPNPVDENEEADSDSWRNSQM